MARIYKRKMNARTVSNSEYDRAPFDIDDLNWAKKREVEVKRDDSYDDDGDSRAMLVNLLNDWEWN